MNSFLSFSMHLQCSPEPNEELYPVFPCLGGGGGPALFEISLTDSLSSAALGEIHTYIRTYIRHTYVHMYVRVQNSSLHIYRGDTA